MINVLKYGSCSFTVDSVLRFSREEFIAAYLGTGVMAGARQAERLNQVYDNALTAKGVDIPSPLAVAAQPTPDDNSNDEQEVEQPRHSTGGGMGTIGEQDCD